MDRSSLTCIHASQKFRSLLVSWIYPCFRERPDLGLRRQHPGHAENGGIGGVIGSKKQQKPGVRKNPRSRRSYLFIHCFARYAERKQQKRRAHADCEVIRKLHRSRGGLPPMTGPSAPRAFPAQSNRSKARLTAA